MAGGLFTLARLMLTIKRVALTVGSELTKWQISGSVLILSFQLPCSVWSSNFVAK